MRPRRVAQLVWLVALSILLGYEAVALFMGYEWTLTAGARQIVDERPWVGAVSAGVFAWLLWHVLWERRKDGR
ncbi:MAG: hypothetical protein N2109_12705 [Fimbriimonadales bacterium]|nr:hypothetical protein [Fimbriimonadales bacterium]